MFLLAGFGWLPEFHPAHQVGYISSGDSPDLVLFMVIHLKAAHPLGCWAWCPPGLSSPAGGRNGFDRTLFTGGGGYPLVHDTVISRWPPLSLVLKDSWQLYQFVLFEEKAVLSYLKGRRKNLSSSLITKKSWLVLKAIWRPTMPIASWVEIAFWSFS